MRRRRAIPSSIRRRSSGPKSSAARRPPPHPAHPVRGIATILPLKGLLVLSAKTETALDQATNHLREFLVRNESVNMSDVAYTLQIGRKAFSHRRCLVCGNRQDAIAVLGDENSKRISSSQTAASRRPAILLLPGIGDHYVGMAHDLYESWPVFREEIDRCAKILEAHLGADIRSIIYPDSQNWKKRSKPKGIDLKQMLGRKTDAP